MFKLAHFSDPHLGPLPKAELLQLMSKRSLGYLNWQRNRSGSMAGGYLQELVADLQSCAPDHVALTGDLVNIALPDEIKLAGLWLKKISPARDLSVIPGNHDAYVPGALKSACQEWHEYMCGDDAALPVRFPYVRKRANIALIGVSSATATGPFMATGRVGRKQLDMLGSVLGKLATEDLFRVVMIHHPPFRNATSVHKRLMDARAFRKVIRQFGAELILHGHTHIDSRAFIEGPTGSVPVIGVPSASSAPGGHRPGARYNLFHISGNAKGWQCHLQERGFASKGQGISLICNDEMPIPGSRASVT